MYCQIPYGTPKNLFTKSTLIVALTAMGWAFSTASTLAAGDAVAKAEHRLAQAEKNLFAKKKLLIKPQPGPISKQDQQMLFLQGIKTAGLSPEEKRQFIKDFQDKAVEKSVAAYKKAIADYKAKHGKVDKTALKLAAASRDAVLRRERQKALDRWAPQFVDAYRDNEKWKYQRSQQEVEAAKRQRDLAKEELKHARQNDQAAIERLRKQQKQLAGYSEQFEPLDTIWKAVLAVRYEVGNDRIKAKEQILKLFKELNLKRVGGDLKLFNALRLAYRRAYLAIAKGDPQAVLDQLQQDLVRIGTDLNANRLKQ